MKWIEVRDYHCPKMGWHVSLSIEINRHRSGLKEVRSVIACSEHTRCDIATEKKPGSFTFKWPECPAWCAFQRK